MKDTYIGDNTAQDYKSIQHSPLRYIRRRWRDKEKNKQNKARMNGERQSRESKIRRREEERNKRERVMNNETPREEKKKRGTVKQETKFCSECCFRLMAHLRDVSETLFGSRSKRGRLVNHRGNG